MLHTALPASSRSYSSHASIQHCLHVGTDPPAEPPTCRCPLACATVVESFCDTGLRSHYCKRSCNSQTIHHSTMSNRCAVICFSALKRRLLLASMIDPTPPVLRYGLAYNDPHFERESISLTHRGCRVGWTGNTTIALKVKGQGQTSPKSSPGKEFRMGAVSILERLHTIGTLHYN